MTRFYNALAALAVILTPVAMMSALGWAVYAAVLTMTGAPWLAVLSGVATAAALEVVGIVAGETALWFHGQRDRRWLGAAAVLAVYVAVGLATLRGTALAYLPVLAGAVYVLVGLRAQAQRESAADEAQAADARAAAQGAADADRAWQHEQWRIQQADRTAVKLARLQAELQASASSQQAAPSESASSVLASTNGHGPAASSAVYQCKHCASTFPTMQALGGHVRAAHKEQV